MMEMHIKNFAQNVEFNTFIGGVGAELSTPALLASKLGISRRRILKFRVVGTEVRARIKGVYTIPANAFGQLVGLGNQNITSYKDKDNLVTSVGKYAFTNSTVNEIEFFGLQYYGNYAFSNTKVVTASFPNLIGGSDVGNMFRNTTTLTSLYINSPYLSTNNSNGFNIIRSCPNLVIFEMLNLKVAEATYIETPLSSLSGTPNIETLNAFCFHTAPNFTTLNIPSAINLKSSCFYNMPNCSTYILNNVTNIAGDAWTINTYGITLIELKKCKTFTSVNFLVNEGTGAGSNFTVRINEALSGHVALVHLRDTRGCTIELYNDAGTFVGIM